MSYLETSYTTHDGLKLYLQAWMPEKPKAGMLLVHGLGEHSGRYGHIVEKLNVLGVAVFTFDGRGHGKSVEGKPTAYFDSYEDYLKDIDALFGKVKAYLPGLPAFLYGHSMGGGLVAAYILKFKPEAKGVILSSPAIKEAEGTSYFLITISGLINRLLPKLKVLKLDILGISRIPEEVEKYKKDPLIYQENIPARTGYELYQMMQFIQQKAGEFGLPFLLIHGEADRLTNPNGSELLFEKAKSADKTLKIFPGGYHELVNDSDREEVMQVIVDWVGERI
ncbi:MAG: lysophospholipase [Algoriphagus sp.]|uniref:alpha/beta hydrolase n=1 Tax=Algoriphagus sp. TaxID=1872435 RepID=UPI0027287A8C|nr:alpha/beta hydrolase [Algoriphagus sp.]MDO8966040.1 lysophospholipase [Algoriphagus sp.]MDP2042285.1 lysophospholipase [Algoriphagus sp.]MDP3200268.1 lysophospholipase [Algoriphagus sp.]MDP3474028.1 lysophospholipase [Algoriphagus sp.]